MPALNESFDASELAKSSRLTRPKIAQANCRRRRTGGDRDEARASGAAADHEGILHDVIGRQDRSPALTTVSPVPSIAPTC